MYVFFYCIFVPNKCTLFIFQNFFATYFQSYFNIVLLIVVVMYVAPNRIVVLKIIIYHWFQILCVNICILLDEWSVSPYFCGALFLVNLLVPLINKFFFFAYPLNISSLYKTMLMKYKNHGHLKLLMNFLSESSVRS